MRTGKLRAEPAKLSLGRETPCLTDPIGVPSASTRLTSAEPEAVWTILSVPAGYGEVSQIIED